MCLCVCVSASHLCCPVEVQTHHSGHQSDDVGHEAGVEIEPESPLEHSVSGGTVGAVVTGVMHEGQRW